MSVLSNRLRDGSLGLGLGCALVCMCGCQQPAVPSAPPPTAEVAPAPFSNVEIQTANPKANAAAAQAAEQAKAIEELLSARAREVAQENGQTIVEPVHTSPPQQPVKKVAPPAVVPNGTAVIPEIPNIDATKPPAIAEPLPVAPPTSGAPTIASPPSPVPTVSSTAGGQVEADNIATTSVHSSAPRETDELQSLITNRAKEQPRELAAQLDRQLLMFLNNQSVPDTGMLGELPGEDREIVTAVIDGLSNFRNGVRSDSNMLMNRKIRPLIEMAERLRGRGDLQITNPVLCAKVEGFGRYTPFEGKIAAARPQPVVLYFEVENVDPQLDDSNLWAAHFTLDTVLYSTGGRTLWSNYGFVLDDTSRSRKRDFYFSARVTLPPGIPPDQYIMKISIKDQAARRVAETTIPLTLDGPKK